MSAQYFPKLFFSSLAFLLAAMWLILRQPASKAPSDILLHAVLSIVLATLILLKTPRIKQAEMRTKTPWIYAVIGLFLFLGGNIISVNQIQWVGIILIAFSCLATGRKDLPTLEIAKVAFLLYWANPLPSGVFLPLQLFMQTASVNGAESLLQALNIRVWADGMIIKTGLQIYEIPAWCSGMRTASTVLILALGVGFYLRIRGLRLAALVSLALIQSLILNIVRISLVILLAPVFEYPTGFQLLHDSSGVLLVVAILLVSVEANLLRTRQGQHDADKSMRNRFVQRVFSSTPKSMHILREHFAGVLIFILVLALLGAFIYKQRPYHRAMMIQPVAESLRHKGDLESALRAADEAYKLYPADHDWNLARIRIMIMAGKHQKVLTALDQGFPGLSRLKPVSSNPRSIEVSILRAYALIGLKRYEEAKSIVHDIPASEAGNPLLAMILAEIGYYLDDVDQVAENAVIAAGWDLNLKRIRSLYPYLRQHRRWAAISASDRTYVKHTIPAEVFCAVEAAMNLNDTPRLASLLQSAIGLWPEDPRILEPLFFMVLHHEDMRWQVNFADHFSRCLTKSPDPETLFGMIQKAFEMQRPDLAWAAYNHLRENYPQHPAVYLAPGYYGEVWFQMNRRAAGIDGPRTAPYTDLRPYIILGMSTPSLSILTRAVPLKEQVATLHTKETRLNYIIAARDAFRTNWSDQSTAMQLEYALTLELLSEDLELNSTLNSLLRSSSDSERIISIVSEVYARRGDWVAVYENLKDYNISERSSLATALRFCRAQINLRMYLAAQNTAARASKAFPQSSLAAGVLAETELLLNRPEEALRAIRKPRKLQSPSSRMPEMHSLFRSGRLKSGRDFCKSILITVPNEYENLKDIPSAPAAESSLLWHILAIPDKSSFDAYSSRVLSDINIETPFFRKLYACWTDAYRSSAASNHTDIDKWKAIGETSQEQATSLNLLTLLLCRFSKFTEALDAASNAVQIMPDSPLLWYPVISLSKRDPDAAATAAQHCPEDAGIWLAQLVMAHENGNDTTPLVKAAIEARNISPAGLTSGASYLLRCGLSDQAFMLAERASTLDPGYLPAQISTLACALLSEDLELARKAARSAIEVSNKPDISLYQKYVELYGNSPDPKDRHLLNAIQSLRRAQPDVPRWSIMLSKLRFLRGGWENVDAHEEFLNTINMGVTNVSGHLVAAEASRRLGNPGRGAQILRDILLDHPDNIDILNNLAYTLASVQPHPVANRVRIEPSENQGKNTDKASFITREEALEEALQIAPKLMDMAPDNLAVLDTCTFVYIETGRNEEAAKVLAKLKSKTKDSTIYSFKAALHSARLEMNLGRSDKALAMLNKALHGIKGADDEDLMKAKALLVDVLAVEQEKNRKVFMQIEK